MGLHSYVSKYYCNINISANQLGDLWVQWEIPIIKNTKQYIIPCPFFKYRMPKLLGIPLLISEIAETTITSIYSSEIVNNINSSIKSDIINLTKIIENYGGSKSIIITTPINLEKKYNIIRLQIKIKNYICTDPIFFDFTYGINSIFPENTMFNIAVYAHFSYMIKGVNIYCSQHDIKLNKFIGKFNKYKYEKNGDLIKLSIKDYNLKPENQLDIHITGSRLPIFIPKIIFWIIIFIFTIIYFLLPIILLCIDLLIKINKS